MTRELDPLLSDAIEQPVVRPFLALHIDLPDPVRVFTGVGTMTFEGADWIGAGGIGAVDTIGEATDGSATGVKATLYNIPADFRDDIADQATKGALFELWVGAFDEAFQNVVAVKLLWKGKLDTYQIVDGGDTLSVEVTGESRMRDQGRPSIKRFTNEWHQRYHSGDKFFEYVPQMAEIPILWAQASQFAIGTGGSATSPGGSIHRPKSF